ncbi:DUF2157 domain-containing protein [Salinilacihabitans rarus]|uniref:DUF2157 domain-containing protein n=1 Tax=Salinilacihabitans rarus TaxID=2961596 RepID=UPI0020C92191|nr:DUF2157 domain-containing protein [Salinilacihabitans rarus]
MDPRELRDEADEWVDAGIVSREQADAIVARYEGDGGGRSRLVVGLALMGAVLVGAGLFWLLADVWDGLGRAARTAVLVAVPLGAAAAGEAASRNRAPRVGHALRFLAAAFVGPSVFMLADVWSLSVSVEWLLLVWAAVALPVGHVRTSRPTVALGLLVAGATVFTLEAGVDLPVAVGLFGVVVFALGSRYRRRGERRLADAYRIVGALLAIGTLLALSFEGWGYDRRTLEASAVLVAAALAAVGAALATRRAAAGRGGRAEWTWTAAAAAGVLVAAGVISLVPPLPGFAALLAVHALSLAALVATVGVAAATDSPAFANLVAVALFVQIASFFASTLIEAMPGATALVVVGTLLLLVALALERGRRRLLERIADEE